MTSLIIKSKIGLENYFGYKQDNNEHDDNQVHHSQVQHHPRQVHPRQVHHNHDKDSESDNSDDEDDEDEDSRELPSGSAFVFDALPDYITDNVDITFPATKLTFDKARKIYTGNHTTVFRGLLTEEDDSMDPVDVVIKIDMFDPHPEGLINEAKFYTKKLNDLQGLVIPLYYGIYQATFGSDTVTCLVLQYCGEPVEELFRDLDVKFKKELMNRLGYIHHFGVAHGDLRELNVLDNHGVPVIVDFEHARDHHCHRTQNIVWGDLRPYRSEFGCDEVYDFALNIEAWMNSAFDFYGKIVVVRKLKSAEELFEMAPARYKTTEVARQEIWKEARDIIKSLANHSQFQPNAQAPESL